MPEPTPDTPDFYRPAPRGESAIDAGILLANLGSPDAPTAKALRPYLREFLGDGRVIEPTNRLVWWLVLNGIVLRTRPAKSARAYAKIWTPEGSPLIVGTQSLGKKLEATISALTGTPVAVAVAMRYGNPSMQAALDALDARGVRRLLVVPLYPQYSAASTASVFDALFDALKLRRLVPETRLVADYHAEPAWIRAVAGSIKNYWDAHGEPQLLLMSFHGVPLRYVKAGDPYRCQCLRSARAIADELGLSPDRWALTFQSRFGREPWLEPYTDIELPRFAAAGVKTIDVVCPGFSVDCLETLEEIAMGGAEIFTHAGGDRLRYIPALNDSDAHAHALADFAARHMGDWLAGSAPVILDMKPRIQP